MSRSAIQFQKGLSLPEFQRLYGTEVQCEAALEKARWPDGFRCPRCQGHEHGLVYGRRLKRYQCRTCGHQATLTAGTIMQATKLPLITWFLAFYLIGQAKTGISSLELSRHLGVNYDTAWLLHNKILHAMTERDEAYLLRGKIQMDDAYLGGERPGGKAGRGSENKIPIVAAVSLNDVNRHRKLRHFRHRKVSHPRPGLGPCFRSGSALAAPAVPLFAHGFRVWLRWLSSVLDAGGAVPAVFSSDLLGWRRWRFAADAD